MNETKKEALKQNKLKAISTDQEKEIIELRNIKSTTRRVVSTGLEKILYKVFPILDHGFIRVIDYMGDDQAIVQAARVSYGKGTRKTSEDEGLIRYLMRHRHSTPFEMCEIKFHIKLPIFVARQWIRNRSASVNEYSARYSILDKEFYIPDEENISIQSDTIKQGRGTKIDSEYASKIINILKEDAIRNYNNYTWMLNEESDADTDRDRHGIARELARINLTLNSYTQWYWKIDLHNLMHFLSLRADLHAQYEIRVYAERMLNIFESWLPLSYKAFMSYRFEGVTLSGEAIRVINRKLSGEKITKENSGLSSREWNELGNIFDVQ